ncbi:MAG: sulfatase, partial [Thermoanaerobaculia bacterium]|nr:sulfatase [Thermoanaerobaculia bacterium]
YSGRSLVLLFSARLPSSGASFVLSDARLHAVEPTTSPTPPHPTPDRPSGLDPPNVVLIILDAARADAFSLYGAERATTPNLEALAEKSYVFDRVTADCPYTLCSSPTILTGLSFLHHGVIARGLRISEEVTTLAERLADAGYYTLGVTSNPNNSQRIGLRQGFDDYYNTWKYGGPVFSRDPANLQALVVKGLDAAPSNQPVFLMAHYVPPHEPYAPPPEFDIFTDPDYDGVVSKKLKLQQRILQRRIQLDDRDLVQFRALYDGNLRMADAWVGTLLETLEDGGLLENSIVVVTSDHGEAFREHGRFSHNSTVFEEMMHVPLVLRLPKGWTSPTIDEDRLVALTDIVPTLLNLVGVPGAEDTDGSDLFGPDDPDRVVYMRSSQPKGGSWGARTRSHKAVVDPEHASLFNLDEDHLERRDGIAESPALFYALLARLEAAALSAGNADDDTDTMLPEEIETLKALGYL